MADKSIKERTVELMKALHITREEFASKIGTSRTSIYDWLKGNNRDLLAVINIPQAFPKVSTEWLFRGEGTMFINGEDDLPDGIPHISLSPYKYNKALESEIQTLSEEPVDTYLINTLPDDTEDLLSLCNRQQKLLNILYIKLGEYRGQLQLYREFVKEINQKRAQK